MSTDVRALFDRYAEAWERRDAVAIAAMHTEDSVYHLHAGSEPAQGREAVREAFAELFRQWPDISFDLVEVLVGDDFWAVEWKVRSGAFEADLADVVKLEGGLVKSKQSYIDSVAVQAQLETAAAPAA
jgi:uncharacterized protein (TIGR02246 family)